MRVWGPYVVRGDEDEDHQHYDQHHITVLTNLARESMIGESRGHCRPHCGVSKHEDQR